MNTDVPVTTPLQDEEIKKTSSHRNRNVILAILSVLLLLIGAVVGTYFFMMFMNKKTEMSTNAAVKKEVNALTIYDWWTSGGEQAAINNLITQYSAKYPDVAVMASPIIGGAGVNAFPVIQKLVLAGQAPDAFQVHAAYEAQPYFDAGLLSPIDYIWKQNNLEAVVPPVIQDMNRFNGHYYAVPVDVHRSNVVWYNKKVLDKAGIDPKTLTTWDSFFAACDKLKAIGITHPIAMGSSWATSHPFEQIMAGEGISFYQDWVNGKITSPDNTKLIDALTTFKKYLLYVNPDYATLTWDQATKNVINGTAAFNVMGDWENGEFTLIGMKYGIDYGSFVVPGTSGMYGLVIDSFEHPTGITHPTNSDRWLTLVSSKEGQDTFNPLKGSISARSDMDETKYGLYQQSAIKDFKTAIHMYPSVVHGSGAPVSFKLKLFDIISQFAIDADVSKAANAMTTQTKNTTAEYTKHWSLQ
jgi:glucose/mannose transport system substrate-binding protein